MNTINQNHKKQQHRVVIIGGGFGGLYAARKLGNAPVSVTLIDKRNFHLFQPLLYQVATGGLSPGDIASPIRAVLNRYRNIRVIQGEVNKVDPVAKVVYANSEAFPYDSLVVATGATHHYFGNTEWAENAPGLKTIEDALQIRSYIFEQFEIAEREPDPQKRQELLTFVLVGGGPTGVEMAGAIAELAFSTLRKDFRNIDTGYAKVILLEAGPFILPAYPEKLSEKAKKALEKLGVIVRTSTMVTDIQPGKIQVKTESNSDLISAKTIVWSAGVKASGFSKILSAATHAETDRGGRIAVNADLSIPNHPDIFVIGDLALFKQDGKPLPGVAPVAMQQGKYVANLIRNKVSAKKTAPFRYLDKGNLAVIGRNAAVAQIWKFHLSGWLAWVIWLFVHIAYLIEFDNRMMVLFQWGWNYFTRNSGARLITGEINKIFAAKETVESE